MKDLHTPRISLFVDMRFAAGTELRKVKWLLINSRNRILRKLTPEQRGSMTDRELKKHITIEQQNEEREGYTCFIRMHLKVWE